MNFMDDTKIVCKMQDCEKKRTGTSYGKGEMGRKTGMMVSGL